MSRKKRKNPVSQKGRKKIRKMPKWIFVLGCILAAVLIVILICFTVMDNSYKSELCNNQWISSSATNASGDEVEMSDIYNTNYTSYQGTLNFNDDGSFSLWLTPGSSDDGTHSGVYEIVDDSKIDVVFDDTTYTSFYTHRDKGEITSISLYYEDYEVFFTKA